MASTVKTIKLVVIGSSGVGKTSLRGKYLSGRFSNGYRATIGADFITKTLPHPNDPSQSIILQIWDTAGQERFSSLSAAFFRGADAALLMFDVNTPDSMFALKKWWDEFCDRAPVADEDMNDYCCVVVGNKIDTIVNGKGLHLVSKSDALAFLDELVPPSSSTSTYPSPSPFLAEQNADLPVSKFLTSLTLYKPSSLSSSSLTAQIQTHSNSVDIHTPNHTSHPLSPSRKLIPSHSHSSPHFYTGTMSSTITIYHTPSSSFYHSASSSPESLSLSEPTSLSSSFRHRKLNSLSSSSESSGSAATFTPCIRENGSSSNTNTSNNLILTASSSPSHSPPLSPSPSPLLPPLERGPKLFFTSAKTGEGVADVFEYIAYRVSQRWEYEEKMQARRMYYPDSSATDTVHLGLDNGVVGQDLLVRHGRGSWGHRCCS